MKPYILIVEDERKVAELLRDYLVAGGYGVRHLERGDEVVEAVRMEPPQLVLLDIMLPGLDGLDVLRRLRQFSSVPVIMLTARIEEIDRLLGLELGADDYICKPFSPREVMARIKAILRRVHASSEREEDVSLDLDVDAFRARFRGQPLELTPVEFRLLQALADNPGRVYSREQLLDRIYPDYRVVTDRTVDSHIKNLRRKLQGIAPDEEVIRSVYGVGYKLEL